MGNPSRALPVLNQHRALCRCRFVKIDDAARLDTLHVRCRRRLRNLYGLIIQPLNRSALGFVHFLPLILALQVLLGY